MVANQTTSSNNDQCSNEDVLTTTLAIINNPDRQTWKSINSRIVSLSRRRRSRLRPSQQQPQPPFLLFAILQFHLISGIVGVSKQERSLSKIGAKPTSTCSPCLSGLISRYYLFNDTRYLLLSLLRVYCLLLRTGSVLGTPIISLFTQLHVMRRVQIKFLSQICLKCVKP